MIDVGNLHQNSRISAAVDSRDDFLCYASMQICTVSLRKGEKNS